jgi:predicted GIY-YIG superfamily endonuclease
MERVTHTSPHIIIGAVPPTLHVALYSIIYGDGSVYVGETCSLRERLDVHACKNGKIRVAVLACCMPDKSAARRAETIMQKLCKQEGLALISECDAAHEHF